MQILKHLGAVAIGITFGWLANEWLSSTPENSGTASVADHLATQSSSNTKIIRSHSAETLNEVSLAKAPEPNEVASKQSPISLINELLEMDDASFEQFMYQPHEVPKELLSGVLMELSSISDLTSRYRLVDFVNSVRLMSLNDQNYDIEDWLVDKIRSNEQQEYWLELASEFGLESIENVAYVAESLDELATPEAQTSALLALSKGIGFGFNKPSNEFNKTMASNLIAPYLSSDDELIRAAAVRTLRQYPSKTFTKDIVNALNDDSEQVRLSAINSLGGFNKPDSETIRSNLLARMHASNASATERLMAWQTLKQLPRPENYYKAIHDFGENEVPRLSELLANTEARSPWSL